MLNSGGVYTEIQRSEAPSKQAPRGWAKTQIDWLDDDEQAVQVATLISGTDITDAALESARELMEAGKRHA